MIGHVQSRKVREVLSYFQWIYSLDSVKLAERFARLNARSSNAHPLTVLLEMNVSGEASKEGIAANRWQDDPVQRGAIWDEVRAILALPGLQIRGLMTVAPIVEDMQAARPVFAALRTLRDALATDFPSAPWDVLSMGMTDDYPVAIEEGATHIRVGRAIFGERMRIKFVSRVYCKGAAKMVYALINLVNLVFKLFELLILARILISWVQADPYSPIVQFLHNTTEPFLAPVRRRLPPTGMFDISPMVVIIIALVINQLLVQVLINFL